MASIASSLVTPFNFASPAVVIARTSSAFLKSNLLSAISVTVLPNL